MLRSLLIAATLGIVTSCVPSDHAGIRRTAPVAKSVEGSALLKALALKVPQGAAASVPSPQRSFSSDPAIAPPFLVAAQSEDDGARALDCLTQAVYYEARSESLDGQRAVAQVVLNRVRDRAFPHSVCGVVYQHGTHSSGCQFTFTCDGAMNARREPIAWDRARTVAAAALSGSVFAPVGSAVFYHTQAVSPWWAPSLSRIGSVGAHIFYRWHDALARSLSFRQSYGGIEPLAPTASVLTALSNAGAASREGGVTVHRAGGLSSSTPRVIEAAGVRIHLGTTSGVGAMSAAEDALPDDERT